MMPRRLRSASAAPLCLLLFAAASLLTGCKGNPYVLEFDPAYSWNLVKTPSWYGDPEAPELRTAEQAVFTNMGRPDRIRFWWRSDGSLITSSDLTGQKDTLYETLKTIDKSWIYLREDKEVVFMNDGGSYSLRDLDPIMRMVADYGDPNHRSTPVVRRGHEYETWLWYEHGIQLELVDGEISEQKRIPRTGAGTWILK